MSEPDAETADEPEATAPDEQTGSLEEELTAGGWLVIAAVVTLPVVLFSLLYTQLFLHIALTIVGILVAAGLIVFLFGTGMKNLGEALDAE